MNRKFFTGLTAILVSLLIIGCGKDNGTPTIKFVPGPGFTGKDTLMKVNDTITVTIELSWNGVDELQQLDVKLNDNLIQSFSLTGDTLTYNLDIKKGTEESDKWTFVLIDKKDNQASVSLTLKKDPNSEYGAIFFYSPVILGAQNNTAKGGFISFQNQSATLFTLESAFSNQSKIELLYYSDELTQATLASPGSDLPENLYPGPRNFSMWTVRDTSRFLKSTMTVQDFNEISNDAPILTGWNDSQSVSKAGELKSNDVWLVKLHSGKKAAILVNRIGTGDAGEIEFAIKIQK